MVEGTTKVFSPSMLLVLNKLFRLKLTTNNYRFWHVIPAGGNAFEVRSGSEGFTVGEGKRTCSCRMWQLSGIPYVHATKVIFLINRVPESYVPAWFETYMYYVAYNNFVKPVPGMNSWPDQSMYSNVLPPKPRKMPGRPRKKRTRAIGEGGSSTRVSKAGSQASCSNCKKLGHNKASCKDPVVEQTPKPKGVPGRPRKKQSDGDVEDVDVVLRGLVSDEGDCRSRGGASVSRGGASRSRGGVSVSKGGASVSKGGAGGSRGGAGGSRGGVGRSKKKHVLSVGTQKRQGKKKVGTFGFAKWFGLQDEPDQTQVEPHQTQHEPVQTQDKDQVNLIACNNQDIPEAESVRPPSRSARSNSRVLEEAENSVDRVSSESFSNGVKIKEGGSILEILEEMITVGQKMGFSMEGCTKDMEKIIGTQGE
ncbi:multidrug resistance-associated protein 5 [Tanacetum coccineum]